VNVENHLSNITQLLIVNQLFHVKQVEKVRSYISIFFNLFANYMLQVITKLHTTVS